MTWTWDAFLSAAEKCHKAGFAFGLPLGVTTDSVEWLGAFFRAFGAEMVDAKGNITVKSDAMRQAFDYLQRLAAFLPPDAAAWDNTSNNKWLVAGKGALIFNPPSAWAVAKRDAPQVAEKLWTHAMPKGPKGRFVSDAAALPGHMELLQEQVGGQEPACSTPPAAKPRRSWLPRATATTCRPTSSSTTSRPGTRSAAQGHHLALPKQGRPGSDHPVCTGPAGDRRTRSTPRPSPPRWSCAWSRASPWRRRWTGPAGRSRASRATEPGGSSCPRSGANSGNPAATAVVSSGCPLSAALGGHDGREAGATPATTGAIARGRNCTKFSGTGPAAPPPVLLLGAS